MAVVLTAASANAAAITPVAWKQSSAMDATRLASNLANANGMDGTQTYLYNLDGSIAGEPTSANDVEWVTRSEGASNDVCAAEKVWIVVDLGAAYDLGMVHIWNFNWDNTPGSPTTSLNNRGTKQFDVYVRNTEADTSDGTAGGTAINVGHVGAINLTNCVPFNVGVSNPWQLVLSDQQIAQAPNNDTYTGQSYNLLGSYGRFVAIVADSYYGGQGIGLGKVRFQEAKGIVHRPEPSIGQTGVEIDLSSRTVPGAVSWLSPDNPDDPDIVQVFGYNVYVDTNQTKVANATPASADLLYKSLQSGGQTGTSFAPGANLAYDTTYYWRVDAVVDLASVPGTTIAEAATVAGSVWSFETIVPVDWPKPSDGQTNAATSLMLSWKTPVSANLTYDVYFGTDLDAVAQAGNGDFDALLLLAEQWLGVGDLQADRNNDNKVDLADFSLLAGVWKFPEFKGNQTGSSFYPGVLAEATQYYWRVDAIDEFNNVVYQGDVWSFATVLGGWHVASTVYPTDEVIVTPYDPEDFGIVADGTTDVTNAIQTALNSIDNLGGGALFLPAGNYKVSGNLTVPGRVTIRGDWQKPVPGNPVVGTILQAYAGRGNENGTPFIELRSSSGINGITIWYPEQLPTDIQPYPPTIHGGGTTVENVTFVNSYIGFTTYQEGITARPFVRNVYGTPLKTGIEFDCLADIGRMETVHFSPDYWAGSGLANAPTAGQHEAWIYNNGTGVIVRRIDWSYSCYVTVDGYSIGLALRPSRYDGNSPNGQSYGFNLLNCKTGIYVEESGYPSYQFTRFNIQGAETGVYLGTSAIEADMFHTCTINASGDAIFSEGTARVMMMSCAIQQGTVDMDGGYLSVMNSSFTSTTPNHIELAGGVHGASILGNTFSGAARITESTFYPVNIIHTPLAADPLPAYDYKKPTTAYKPAKSDLFVVTYYPYNAAADGVTDDTAAFQAALADAGANGGGIVFVPGGNYRLDGTLTVPTGVELKGIYDNPHSTSQKGSLLNVYAGRNNANGTPFIQIESGAGIRGLTFHYPEQIYNENDNDPVIGMYGMVPYPFLIRGLGSDVYVINIAATIPYQLLDLATYRCDRHYIDYILSTALKTGIHVGSGSVDGQIHNCQLNPSVYTQQSSYYDSIPANPASGIHTILWRDALPYLFGNMSGEVLHENFVFGAVKGVHLVQEGGFGPSGYCMGMGVDSATTALYIDDIGSGGLDMINSQIVSTNSTNGRYLETSASLTDTFRMFGSAAWGSHQYSAVINGGNVRLQLFHLVHVGGSGVFKVANTASLQNLGGNLKDLLPTGRPFLTINSTATAAFIGNIINVSSSSQMPTNTANVTSIGNLRVY
jgi:hypothetical protein